MVCVQIDELALLKYEVMLYGIPSSKKLGSEVTVNFYNPSIKNKGVFYTDSNGLEMQKRTLNFRPTWNLTTSANTVAPANYYPVQTAIAIVDTETDLQMLVMNTRSQGGSALQEGRIELMQNRRLYFDDGRGMGEPLNETDSSGNGISVFATYFVQIFKKPTRSSL